MSNDSRPVIGIPARSIVDASNGFRYSGIPLTYSNAVERAGGAPVLIPLHLSEETLEAIYSRIDALLLAGGVDVHPKEFGEDVMPYCGEIDTARDETELRVTRWALADGHPIFGICRGIQMLNVAAGGSLYQDIPAQLKTEQNHSYRQGDPYNLRAHPVELEPTSRVARWLGAPALQVNSLHHQSLKQVAPGLRVIARAPDGVIEAVESENDQFRVGVQWHPELLEDDARMAKLFEAFVASASEFRAKRNGH
ncbi:MAG: gamma-glutamyl-gamma-aminobutyrate hydrolase family protein [Chloroflexi bacterium]|nr:gamma-glutamyl-gamma-aminobutyrate hydrolase family protein [Chloroflexota bacterium]